MRFALSKFIAPLALILVCFLSVHKIFSFYFWHDDFAVFYGVRLKEMIVAGPYITFWPIFGFLYRFLGYHPQYYFVLGSIMFTISALVFYWLLQHLFNKKSAFLLALVYSTGYIGAGVFREAYDPIITFPSLTFLFLSIVYYLKTTQQTPLNKGNLLLSFVFFGLSIVWFFARSATYFFPLIFAIMLLGGKTSLKTKVALVFASLGTFLFFFLWGPSLFGNKTVNAGESLRYLPTINMSKQLDFFAQTMSSFTYTDSLEKTQSNTSASKVLLARRLIGSATILAIALVVVLGDRKKRNLRLFSLLWIVFLYLPYNLRSDWRLESYHRYLIFAFPGVLFFWGTLERWKFWKPLTLALIVVYFISTRQFLSEHGLISSKQGDFFKQLHAALPSINPQTSLFFSISPGVKNSFEDFFRVGTTPPESALGAEYGIEYKNLTIYTESNDLTRSITTEGTNKEKLNTLNWDGEKLEDTTSLSRRQLADHSHFKINVSGKNPGFNFNIPLLPTVPLYAKFVMTAKCTGDCFSEKYSGYSLKSKLTVHASNFGENHYPENLLDSDPETQWMANRQDWFAGKKPIIELTSSLPFEISGLTLTTSSRRKPTKITLTADNSLVSAKLEEFDQGIKIFFPNRKITKIQLKLEETSDTDSPVVYEIDPITDPISGKSTSVLACFNNQRFQLLIDGFPHEYRLIIPPAPPGEKPNNHLACLDSPVDVNIISVQLDP